jgi:hypothetical protein
VRILSFKAGFCVSSLVALCAVMASPQAHAAEAAVVVKTFDISGSGSCARMRMGDLNSDGRLDFMMVQPTDDNPSYVRMLTAYDGVTGEKLWHVGTDNGLTGTDRDEPAQIHDIDGDGHADVVAAMEGELRYFEGATGKLKKSFKLPASLAHDAIMFANLSKNPSPQDIILKDRYSNAWAIDKDGKLLWTYKGITGHYPWPYDIDGDGRDEVFIGYNQLDYLGKPKYPAPFNEDHPDCIWVGDIDANPDNGLEVLYGIAKAPSLHAISTRTGKVVWTNDAARESQQVIFGDFRKDLPGLEVYGMDRVNRTTQDAVFVVSSAGKTLWKETPDNSGFGTAIKLIRDWDGTKTPMCLAIKRGSGVLPEVRDGTGAVVMNIGKDGENAAIGDFAGDSKQEVVMYDKTVATFYAVATLDWSVPPPTPGKPMKSVKEYYNYSRYGSGDPFAFEGASSLPITGIGGAPSTFGSTLSGTTAGAPNAAGSSAVETGSGGQGPTSGGTSAIQTRLPSTGSESTGTTSGGSSGNAESSSTRSRNPIGGSSGLNVSGTLDSAEANESGCACRAAGARGKFNDTSVALLVALSSALLHRRRKSQRF